MAKKFSPKYPIEHISWWDHWGSASGGWHSFEEIDANPLLCCSVGFVLKEDKKGVLLVTSHDNQEDAPASLAGSKYIIKNCIVKRTRLK